MGSYKGVLYRVSQLSPRKTSDSADCAMKHDIPSLTAEIHEGLDRLEACLPERIDGPAISLESKLPSKALWYREAIIWRFAELCRSSYEAFLSDKLATAMLLTRSTLESTAAIWYLNEKIQRVVESGTIGDFDDCLMKLIVGSRTDPAMPEAINVLNFVDTVEKKVRGFRNQYDQLSEFAHPNWASTALLYSKPDTKSGVADFGPNMREAKNVKLCGLINLSVSLLLFENVYNEIADAIPSFVQLCES